MTSADRAVRVVVDNIVVDDVSGVETDEDIVMTSLVVDLSAGIADNDAIVVVVDDVDEFRTREAILV